MSGDEVLVALLGAGTGVIAWARWYTPLMTVDRLGARTPGVGLLMIGPLFCAALLFYVLRTLSSHDVQDALVYIAMYLAVGAGWVGLGTLALPLLGVSARDDVMERGNAAAAPVLAGALLGLTLCFAGGNVGDGPGWWVVVFSAALATTALALGWYALELAAGIADTVTIERDLAAGLRVGALLAANGLVLGRAVAGDWVSAGGTLRDFAHTAWPLLLLQAAAVFLERSFRPDAERPTRSPALHGALPGLLYLAAASLYVIRLGPPA